MKITSKPLLCIQETILLLHFREGSVQGCGPNEYKMLFGLSVAAGSVPPSMSSPHMHIIISSVLALVHNALLLKCQYNQIIKT